MTVVLVYLIWEPVDNIATAYVEQLQVDWASNVFAPTNRSTSGSTNSGASETIKYSGDGTISFRISTLLDMLGRTMVSFLKFVLAQPNLKAFVHILGLSTSGIGASSSSSGGSGHGQSILRGYMMSKAFLRTLIVYWCWVVQPIRDLTWWQIVIWFVFVVLVANKHPLDKNMLTIIKHNRTIWNKQEQQQLQSSGWLWWLLYGLLVLVESVGLLSKILSAAGTITNMLTDIAPGSDRKPGNSNNHINNVGKDSNSCYSGGGDGGKSCKSRALLYSPTLVAVCQTVIIEASALTYCAALPLLSFHRRNCVNEYMSFSQQSYQLPEISAATDMHPFLGCREVLFFEWQCVFLVICMFLQALMLMFCAGYLSYRRTISLELRAALDLLAGNGSAVATPTGIGTNVGTTGIPRREAGAAESAPVESSPSSSSSESMSPSVSLWCTLRDAFFRPLQAVTDFAGSLLFDALDCDTRCSSINNSRADSGNAAVSYVVNW
eukprot:CAMPEP_0174981604 /NCGR_PEP_ID=MMETSP0004_2-20121128/15988_1 /TAXON_ID=420556 /ORGANISM="Ochromonas sp., Strain CCMP1393" /LENGTH=491 /DNA_ID=CAMNT_0016233379 /DNA_START=136 /DNA_END=1608 /DNA_ORIENTATION=+